MNITASMVKDLRTQTGAGMMDCKKALVEAEGDIAKAVDILREKGLSQAAKKASRVAAEGAVGSAVSEDGKTGTILEVNCETDFVGTNEDFRNLAASIADQILAVNPADVEALLDSEIDGKKVRDLVTEAVAKIGENISVRRFVRYESAEGKVYSYIHGGGKIGVLVEFKLGDASFATNDDFKKYGRDVAMQVAAASPVSATRESVDPAVVEHEMSIYKAQAAESGKPENIQEKIATGRMEKFYKENCLTEQAFVKNPDQNVTDYVNEVAKKLGGTIKVTGFKRFMLGE